MAQINTIKPTALVQKPDSSALLYWKAWLQRAELPLLACRGFIPWSTDGPYMRLRALPAVKDHRTDYNVVGFLETGKWANPRLQPKKGLFDEM